MLNTEDQTALEIVKLAYAVDDPSDSRRCLNMRVGFTDHDGAYDALRAIDSYNDFDGSKVVAALKRANIDKYTRIEVGREGSPVVYIGPIFGDDDQRVRIEAALKCARADEIDFDGRTRRIRAWWD